MKKANVRIISVLLIAFFLLVTPASANIWLSITSTEVQVNYDDRYDAAVLATYDHSMMWAQSVINYAKAHGTTPTRSQYSIAREIQCHAIDYYIYGEGAGNPANIGVMEGNWDFLLAAYY